MRGSLRANRTENVAHAIHRAPCSGCAGNRCVHNRFTFVAIDCAMPLVGAMKCASIRDKPIFVCLKLSAL